MGTFKSHEIGGRPQYAMCVRACACVSVLLKTVTVCTEREGM
jgi:hypothetical protein